MKELDSLRNTLENVEALLLGATGASKIILGIELDALNKRLKAWIISVPVLVNIDKES